VRLKSGAQLRGFGRQVIPSGDRVVLETPGGGGIGDPKKRAREAVEHDLENGLITQQQARDAYGRE
jgi:N-methylhydantoinase B